MEKNKKSSGEDVRAKALSWDDEWGKSLKTSFHLFSSLSPTVGCYAPHSHPHRPKKKPLRGKKVGFAEKNLHQ
ncbi:MAG: hypothetical protein PUE80_03580 [bacterium]|nr:hypothetical protein [bacterium]